MKVFPNSTPPKGSRRGRKPPTDAGRQRTTLLIPAALAAISVVMVSACSVEQSGADAGNGPANVKATVLPVIDSAAIYLGKDKGFFDEEGLNLTIEASNGGAAAIPGVVSGSYDFGFSNYVSIMVARDKGLDLKVVANAASANGTPGPAAVVVPNGSSIKSPADLSGKKVSINNLENIGDTVIRRIVDEDGGDSTKIQFVEVAFSGAEAALANGQVDASFLLDPFLVPALSHGNRVVTYNFADFDPKLDISGFFASGRLVQEKPELAAKFRSAMNKSLAYAQANPDEVRRIVTTYTKLTDEQLKDMKLPAYNSEFNRESLKKLGDAALEYGTLKQATDVDAMLP